MVGASAMTKPVSLFVAGLLFLASLGIPLFFIGWWGSDALQRRRILVEGNSRPATVLRKTSEWGGRAYGTQYFAEVRVDQPALNPSVGSKASIPVTEQQYAQLKPGQQVAIRINPGVDRPGLLAGSRWWSWTHLGWICFGFFLLGYLLKLATAQLWPRVAAPSTGREP
jgi:hypothetical protein